MKRSDIPVAQASILLPMIEYFERHGGSRADIWGGLGLEPEEELSPARMLPAHAIYQTADKIAKLSGDQFLGVKVGIEMAHPETGVIGQKLQNAQTVGELLNTFIELSGRMGRTADYTLEVSSRSALFRMQRVTKAGIVTAQPDAIGVALFVDLFRDRLSGLWDTNDILAIVSDPTVIPSTLLPSSSVIRAENNGFILRFPIAWLSWRQGSTDNGKTDPEQMAEFIALDFVRSYVRDNLASPELNISTAAKACGLHERKLRRLLYSQGSTFAELHDEARRTFAWNEVRFKQRTFTEIAFDCGYSKLSNFSRAFKRWHGCSPTACRHSIVP